jgi:hypothetical protein
MMNSGVKDNFLDHFCKKLEQARKGHTWVAAEHAIYDELQKFPSRPWNLVWNFHGK